MGDAALPALSSRLRPAPLGRTVPGVVQVRHSA